MVYISQIDFYTMPTWVHFEEDFSYTEGKQVRVFCDDEVHLSIQEEVS